MLEGKEGIDIEIKNASGRTPLLEAAKSAASARAEDSKEEDALSTWLVKEAGADIHTRDDKGNSAADLYRNLESDEDHEVLRLLKGE